MLDVGSGVRWLGGDGDTDAGDLRAAGLRVRRSPWWLRRCCSPTAVRGRCYGSVDVQPGRRGDVLPVRRPRLPTADQASPGSCRPAGLGHDRRCARAGADRAGADAAAAACRSGRRCAWTRASGPYCGSSLRRASPSWSHSSWRSWSRPTWRTTGAPQAVSPSTRGRTRSTCCRTPYWLCRSLLRSSRGWRRRTSRGTPLPSTCTPPPPPGRSCSPGERVPPCSSVLRSRSRAIFAYDDGQVQEAQASSLGAGLVAFAPGLIGFAVLMHVGRVLYARHAGRQVAVVTGAAWLVVAVAAFVLTLRWDGLEAWSAHWLQRCPSAWSPVQQSLLRRGAAQSPDLVCSADCHEHLRRLDRRVPWPGRAGLVGRAAFRRRELGECAGLLGAVRPGRRDRVRRGRGGRGSSGCPGAAASRSAQSLWRRRNEDRPAAGGGPGWDRAARRLAGAAVSSRPATRWSSAHRPVRRTTSTSARPGGRAGPDFVAATWSTRTATAPAWRALRDRSHLRPLVVTWHNAVLAPWARGLVMRLGQRSGRSWRRPDSGSIQRPGGACAVA